MQGWMAVTISMNFIRTSLAMYLYFIQWKELLQVVKYLYRPMIMLLTSVKLFHTIIKIFASAIKCRALIWSNLYLDHILILWLLIILPVLVTNILVIKVNKKILKQKMYNIRLFNIIQICWIFVFNPLEI